MAIYRFKVSDAAGKVGETLVEGDSRAEAIRLMAVHPNLIKRPLIVRGDEILFGFDAGEWAKL